MGRDQVLPANDIGYESARSVIICGGTEQAKVVRPILEAGGFRVIRVFDNAAVLKTTDVAHGPDPKHVGAIGGGVSLLCHRGCATDNARGRDSCTNPSTARSSISNACRKFKWKSPESDHQKNAPARVAGRGVICGVRPVGSSACRCAEQLFLCSNGPRRFLHHLQPRRQQFLRSRAIGTIRGRNLLPPKGVLPFSRVSPDKKETVRPQKTL